MSIELQDKKLQEHFERLHAATFNTYDITEAAKYLTEYTYLEGERFSFKDHEYQLDIISDPSRVIYCQKCAQVGLTEIQLRYALAIARMIPYFNIIMTWPFAGDAENMVKTRMNPIIENSIDLKGRLNPDLDNVQIKEIGSSLIYARGTTGTTAALSVPADMLIHDEVDRSDPHVLAQYQSRIKHSKWKLVRAFGTPTIDGFGIALLMEGAKRKKHMCKCDKCNFYFVPDYESHVVVPGFDHDKKELTKYNYTKYEWEKSKLLCPSCGREPSLQPEHREWVIENIGDNFEPVGYFVSPFSAPNNVSAADLVRESTVYTTYGEFRNQALGLTTNNDNEQLTLSDIRQGKVNLELGSSELHCMGADMGLICHITIGRMTQAGELLVVYRERVVMEKFEERKRILCAQFRVIISVCDSQPYVDMIQRMQRYDHNLYGGVYHDNRKQAAYLLVKVDKDAQAGLLPINQAQIHRNLNFDELMYLFKAGKVLWQEGMDDELFEKHCTDMRRVQQFDRNNEMIYAWVKSTTKQDHYHHALGYLHVACRLMPTYSRNVSLIAMPVAKRVKVSTPEEVGFFGRRR